jgi:amino acid transporter
MAIGDLNKRFGWFWLTVFVIVGFYIELSMGDPKYLGNWRRELYRALHAHGNLLAVVNLIYAYYAILIPIGLFVMTLASDPQSIAPPVLTWLGGVATIAAVGIMAYGYR